jgi:hypothetical protein
MIIVMSVVLVVLCRVGTLLHVAFKITDRDATRLSNTKPAQKYSNTLLLNQPKGKMRNDWTNNPPLSSLSKKILKHQSNCDLPVSTFHMDNTYGLGSHLTLWSQAVCNAMHQKARLRTENPIWLWMDQAQCDMEQAKRSPLLCYFPKAEFLCEKDESFSAGNISDPRETQNWCPHLLQKQPKQIVYEAKLAAFRAASIEYLFRKVSPVVLAEAERQSGLLFGPDGAPDDLITVHLRWGDKFWEMDLVSVEEYIKGVSDLLEQQGRDNRTANVFLATEDPNAKQAFFDAVPPGWTVYLDRTIDELNDYRPPKGNRASHTAKNTKGRAGLVAMGSLLVAMESRYYVLTTKSNWSRTMDFLRINVIDPRCGNCTRMIDLRPGIW